MNEITFVSELSTETAVRAERRRASSEMVKDGPAVRIESGRLEERETDPVSGHVVRCDMRLNGVGGVILVSGEFKRPEHRDGRDVRSEALRADARRKARARGLPYYFTCNMAAVCLFEVGGRLGEADKEVLLVNLASVRRATDVPAVLDAIKKQWCEFLDRLEQLLGSTGAERPHVTRTQVLLLKGAIERVADECLARAMRRLVSDRSIQREARERSADAFGLHLVLRPDKAALFRDEVRQVLLLSSFVIAQKLILHRVLAEAGRRRKHRFSLDAVDISASSTDPAYVRSVIDNAVQLAIRRSGDFETAFLPTPNEDLLFTIPIDEEVAACRIGHVWGDLLRIIQEASWGEISQNLVGFLYETIIEPRFRRQLGQYYTRDDVVDILGTFAVRDHRDAVLDPACGGGSFLRSAYARKRAMGSTHEDALADIWGCEITTFAAQLASIALGTADAEAPAAYPRIILRDFFTLRPGGVSHLSIPGEAESRIPVAVDAVIGNPPYISYRHVQNHARIIQALGWARRQGTSFPEFSGKSDAYVWFLVHATSFLADGGRLAFVVSSSMLFSDYGVPLVQFIGHHYRVVAVIDSMVEQWFEDADTNTVLLLLEREHDEEQRKANDVRFIRLRRRLNRLIPGIGATDRRQELEALIDSFTTAPPGDEDPRYQVNHVKQGCDGGLQLETRSWPIPPGTSQERDEGEEE
jgi:N-6 DNA methylase